MISSRFQRTLYRFFNNRGREITKCLIATMCADDPAVLTRIRMQRVILKTEKNIANLPFFYFLVLKISIYLIEYALPPISWKIIPFTRMPLERRLKYLDEWASSSFYYKRILLKLICAICLPQVYSEKRLLLSLGYEPSLEHRTGKRWSSTAQK